MRIAALCRAALQCGVACWSVLCHAVLCSPLSCNCCCCSGLPPALPYTTLATQLPPTPMPLRCLPGSAVLPTPPPPHPQPNPHPALPSLPPSAGTSLSWEWLWRICPQLWRLSSRYVPAVVVLSTVSAACAELWEAAGEVHAPGVCGTVGGWVLAGHCCAAYSTVAPSLRPPATPQHRAGLCSDPS